MKALSLVTVLAFVLFLQGCITATVALSTAAIITKTVTDPRTFGTQVDDSTTKLCINRALSKDERISREARIRAVVYHGKVLLIGQTKNTNLALQAEQIAINTKNITEVFNEIRYGKPIKLSTILSDIWITTKIRTKFLSNNQIKTSHIKVITENSEVFLLGLVDEKEGKEAAETVSWISGVKHVTTAFIYV